MQAAITGKRMATLAASVKMNNPVWRLEVLVSFVQHWDEGGVSLKKAQKKETCDKVKTSPSNSPSNAASRFPGASATRNDPSKCCKN